VSRAVRVPCAACLTSAAVGLKQSSPTSPRSSELLGATQGPQLRSASAHCSRAVQCAALIATWRGRLSSLAESFTRSDIENAVTLQRNDSSNVRQLFLRQPNKVIFADSLFPKKPSERKDEP
jgi:hypothetical protein